MNAYVSEPNTPLCSKFMMEEQPVFCESLPGAGGDLLVTHGVKGLPADDVAAEPIDDGR